MKSSSFLPDFSWTLLVISMALMQKPAILYMSASFMPLVVIAGLPRRTPPGVIALNQWDKTNYLRFVANDRILVRCDVNSVKDELDFWSREVMLTDIPKHNVVVSASWNELFASRHKLSGKRLSIFYHVGTVRAEPICHDLFHLGCKCCNLCVMRATT